MIHEPAGSGAPPRTQYTFSLRDVLLQKRNDILVQRLDRVDAPDEVQVLVRRYDEVTAYDTGGQGLEQEFHVQRCREPVLSACRWVGNKAGATGVAAFVRATARRAPKVRGVSAPGVEIARARVSQAVATSSSKECYDA